MACIVGIGCGPSFTPRPSPKSQSRTLLQVSRAETGSSNRGTPVLTVDLPEEEVRKVKLAVLREQAKVALAPMKGDGAPGSEGWPAFEQVECPNVRYDFSIPHPPMLKCLAELTAIAGFLGGYCLNEFGGFEAEPWEEEGVAAWAPFAGRVYWLTMIFVGGYCIHLSVAGMMISAAFHRTLNQLKSWEPVCRLAVEPLTDALSVGDGLKGKRRACYSEVLNEAIASHSDYANTLQIVMGTNRFDGEHVRVRWLQDHEAWEVHFHNPTKVFSDQAAPMVRSLMLPISLVVVLVANTVKGVRKQHDGVAAVVVVVVAIWLALLSRVLFVVTSKLRD